MVSWLMMIGRRGVEERLEVHRRWVNESGDLHSYTCEALVDGDERARKAVVLTRKVSEYPPPTHGGK
jgi:hypothetical protein